MLPVGEELRESALAQAIARLLNERPAQIVPAHPAVAVGQPGARRDHERRVGHDEFVRLVVPDRLEERALAEVGGRGSGQREGERGDVQGAGVEVGGRHARGVPGRVQRLDAGPGAEVERGGDRRPYGDARERGGRAAHPQDDAFLPAADPAGPADRAPQVGHDEPVLAVGPAVRPYVHGRGDLVGAYGDQPPALQALGDGQDVGHACVRHGLLEEEQPDQRLQGVSPLVARRAGTVSLRASAAYAGAPSRSSSPSAVKAAPSRASRSRAATSRRSDAGRVGRVELLTPPLWPLPPTTRVAPTDKAPAHAKAPARTRTGASFSN